MHDYEDGCKFRWFTPDEMLPPPTETVLFVYNTPSHRQPPTYTLGRCLFNTIGGRYWAVGEDAAPLNATVFVVDCWASLPPLPDYVGQ